MRQSENRVKIEGILSEIDLVDGECTRDGRTMPYIRGNVKIRVNYTHEGKEYDIDVPVETFVTKWTKAGKENPAYKSIKDVKDNFVSLAAVDGEMDKADRVRITAGQLTENAFYAQDGTLVSQTRINTSFINKIKKEDCKPEATFVNTMAIGGIIDELDEEGMPSGNLMIKGVIVQYGDRVDLVNYRVENKKAVDYISSNWSQGDTVRVSGILNYSAKTMSTTIENDFGDAITEYRTVNVRELIITGGSSSGFEGEAAYNAEDIGKALAERKARVEATRDSAKKAAPQKATSAAASFASLDF